MTNWNFKILFKVFLNNLILGEKMGFQIKKGKKVQK